MIIWSVASDGVVSICFECDWLTDCWQYHLAVPFALTLSDLKPSLIIFFVDFGTSFPYVEQVKLGILNVVYILANDHKD